MALWNVNGHVVNDADEGVHIPDNAIRLPEYNLPFQYDAPVQWESWQGGDTPQGVTGSSPGYISQLLAWADASEAGMLKPYEQEQWEQMQSQARAVPLRDVSGAYGGWGARADDPTAQRLLNVNSPDIGNFMLTVREKMKNGTATPQERALFQDTARTAADWDFRASVPQESDANPFGLGDNLFGALFTIGLGASGGLAAAPLAAGGATAATTLGSLGTLGGVGGTGLSVIGQALEEPWLANLGKYLGAAGGLTGGVTSLMNLANTGIGSLADAARLASAGGRVTGALGTASGVPGLQQAGRYLGQAGQLGTLGSSAADWLGWSGNNSPLAANAAPGVGNVSNLLSAADMATQRGGGGMSEWDWGGYDTGQEGWGWNEGNVFAGGSPSFNEGGGGGAWDLSGYGTPNNGTPYSMNINDYANPPANWYENTGQYIGGSDPGGGGFLGTLGSLASGAGRLLFGAGGGGAGGGGSGILGPLLSSLGSLGGGAIGSNAANEAARLQAAALNRGIDLQTAQWLQQQGNLAPYLQAGQQGLSTLQGLAGREAPQIQDPSAAISGAGYALPGTMPGWNPQGFSADQYRWTPGQGPRAGDYAYRPGAIPSAANYRYTPGAVPTLSGKELLANDPGYQFRMDESRKALEGSAAARGDLLSGQNLKALQSRSQDLASQEYGQAWNRASEQAQLREGWAQRASEMGYSQAESEARLREQVNQIASQQGWSQAQAEAAFREAMAQQSSQQGYTQALQGQQWNVGQQQEWEKARYARELEQSKYRYGQDVTQNQTDYDRAQALYRQRLAQHLLPWEQQSVLAGLGGKAVGMYGEQGGQATSAIANLLGQQGTANAMGTLGSAGQWNQAIAGGVGGLQNILKGLNA